MRASRCLSWSVRTATAVVAIGSLGLAAAANPQGLVSSDLSRLRSVGGVAASPDGKRVVYTVVMRDRPGRPYGQLWIMDLSTQKSVRVGGDKDGGGSGVWSPDGKWIAFSGHQGDKSGLFVVRPDGSEVTFLADVHGTNSPLPGTGNEISWSPDSKQIAFVSSTPDPRAAEASGDPMVITRYLYKPDAGEGMTRFNDNQRLHIFVVDVATKQVRQLTQGNFDEHSIDWSPDGKEILFASNREPNQDEFFNYDIFALKVADNSIRRLTATEYSEYEPLWSPEGKRIVFRGTRRGLTDRETTMEDTHVWVMNADGSDRREIGAIVDNRQGTPRWAPDGRSVYFAVQERGSMYLMRLPISSGKPEYVVKETGSVANWSLSKDGAMAYAFASPRDAADRGSTGYGQKFADAVFCDQNGNEAQDILYGVSAAVRRNLWIDRERLGIEGVSYGGQLTEWPITQTNQFKAAIPTAGIVNLVSYNYMTYYNQYEEMEFGQFLHQGTLMDVAWQRSALKHVAAAHTPTLILHGENDNDVPIAEAEQFFIGLKDVGTETVFVRYPREGHGLSEVKHVIDSIDRSIAWYEKHFPKPGAEGITNVQP